MKNQGEVAIAVLNFVHEILTVPFKYPRRIRGQRDVGPRKVPNPSLGARPRNITGWVDSGLGRLAIDDAGRERILRSAGWAASDCKQVRRFAAAFSRGRLDDG